jgi:GDP-4-dehydro-6-deoxy-D-mannose reductase
MRVLVTGAAGFTGLRMMELLAGQRGVTPLGLVRRQVPDDCRKPDSFIMGDLLNRDDLQEVVTTCCPDAVIHLAGLTRGTLDALYATNVTGTKNLLDASIAANPGCRILVVSSSAVYGYAGDVPIPETAPLQPVGDYGTSKVAQEILALDYQNRGAVIAIARPFNLAGPGQPGSFVCGRIVKQVVEIEKETRIAIELHEITSARDLIDVRDVVRGYWAIVSHPDFTRDCSGKAFNLGSGNAYLLSEIVTMVEEITGKHYEIRLPETPPAIPVPTQRSNNTRITSLTGWKPEIPMRDTLRDMLIMERQKKRSGIK